MFKRKLGKTGAELSVVGFGGIVVMNETPEFSAAIVKEAVEERGINYFDVAPSYGNAEERLGPALEPYRDQVFLACKTGKRTAVEADEELQASLEKLKTDHFDLYQLHGVTSMEDVDTIFGLGGAMEVFLKARAAGAIKHIGFSAHSEEAAIALIERIPFETVLFPLNWVTWNEGHFGHELLKVAKARGMGILALKALAKRKWGEDEERTWSKTWYYPVESAEEAAMGLRFTLSLGVTACTSPGHAELLRWACDAADNYEPMTEAEKAEVAIKAQGLASIFPQG